MRTAHLVPSESSSPWGRKNLEDSDGNLIKSSGISRLSTDNEEARRRRSATAAKRVMAVFRRGGVRMWWVFDGVDGFIGGLLNSDLEFCRLRWNDESRRIRVVALRLGCWVGGSHCLRLLLVD